MFTDEAKTDSPGSMSPKNSQDDSDNEDNKGSGSEKEDADSGSDN
jgi:hypothetical protein